MTRSHVFLGEEEERHDRERPSLWKHHSIQDDADEREEHALEKQLREQEEEEKDHAERERKEAIREEGDNEESPSPVLSQSSQQASNGSDSQKALTDDPYILEKPGKTHAVDGEQSRRGSQDGPRTIRHLPANLVKVLAKKRVIRKKKQKPDQSKIVNRTLPLFSSITLPLVVVLCIPGLTEHWYVKVSDLVQNPDGTTTTIPLDPSDPRTYSENGPLLDVAISVSLALAIIANIALILRMLERGWKKGPVVPTLVTICCLIGHDVIDTIVCIVFGTVHAVNDGYDYTEAFWLTVGATIISLITTTTLIIDWHRTPNFPEAGSGLTAKQRTLMISVVVMLCFMSLGGLIYVFLEDLTYINSFYFITVISTTVGFGDIVPTTVGSKIVFIIYTILAIIIVGLTISNARVAIIETFQTQYAARRKKLAKKNKERKMARKMHRKLRLDAAKRAAELAALNPDAKPVPVEPPKPMRVVPTTSVRGAARRPAISNKPPSSQSGVDEFSAKVVSFVKRRVFGSEQAKVEHLTLEQLEADLSATLTRDGLEEEKEQQVEKARQLQLLDAEMPDLDMLHQLSIANEQEYTSLQNQLIKEERWDYFYKIQVVLLIFICFWLIGALCFHFLEDWSYFDSIYFVFVFSSTVGLGDFTPKSIAGRAVFIAFALVGIGVMTMLVFVLTEAGGAVTRHLLAKGVVSKMRQAAQLTASKEGSDREHQRYKQQSASHVKARSVQRQLSQGIRDTQGQLEHLMTSVKVLDQQIDKLLSAQPLPQVERDLAVAFENDHGIGHSLAIFNSIHPDLSPDQSHRCAIVLGYREEMRKFNEAMLEALNGLDIQHGHSKSLSGHISKLRPKGRPKMSRHLSLDSDTSDIESHSGTEDSDLDHDHDDDFEGESEFGDDDFDDEDDDEHHHHHHQLDRKELPERSMMGESTKTMDSRSDTLIEEPGSPAQPSSPTLSSAMPGPSSPSRNEGPTPRRSIAIPLTSLHTVNLPLPSLDGFRRFRGPSSSEEVVDDHGLESRLDQARENSEMHAAQPPSGYIGSAPSSPSPARRTEPYQGPKLTRTSSVRFK